MQHRFNFQLIVLLSMSLTLGGLTVQAQTKEAVSILWIGYSLTKFNDLPTMVSELAQAAGQPSPVQERELPGGFTFERHWTGGRALIKLRSQKWDFVVLQEQSQIPLKNSDSMFEYATKFDAEIKKQGGETLLYLPFPFADAPQNQDKLTKLHQDLASQIKARVAPVGIAWAKALAADKPPILYTPDNVHPTRTGSYLAACVFYATIYGKTPEGLPGKIGGVSDEEAMQFQRIAWRVSQDFAAVRN